LPAEQFVQKKSCLRRLVLHTKILSVGHLISVSSLGYHSIGIETIQIQNLVITTTLFVKNSNKESVNNKSFIRSNLVRYKSHNTNSNSKMVYKK